MLIKSTLFFCRRGTIKKKRLFMSDNRFRQEVDACRAAGIVVEPLTSTMDAHCCNNYGYATYHLATVASNPVRVFVVVKPADWPHVGFGVVAADGNTVDYRHPNGGPIAADGTPQTDTLATQLLNTRLPSNAAQSGLTGGTQYMGAECGGLAITCIQTAQCAYLMVRWTPAALSFPRHQLVVVPTDWETRGFGLLSPTPQVKMDNNGTTVMVDESIAITYMSGQLLAVLDQHVARDRASSFSE